MGNIKTVNGVQYRVVTDRDAQVGDYVFYDESPRYFIEEGKPYVVVRVDHHDDPQIIDEEGGEYDTWLDRYELLEKIGTVPNELVTHGGVTYRKVARDARVGDKFVVPNDSAVDYTAGKVYEITEIDSDGDPYFIDDVEDEHFVTSGNYTVLEPISIDEELAAAQARVAELGAMKKKANRLKVGEYAKVVRVDMTCASIGQIVKVIEDDEDPVPFRAEDLKGHVAGWFLESSLVRATDEEVAEALRQIEREKIKPGVYVKLMIADGEEPKYGWGGVCNGDIGKVRFVNGNSVRVDFPKSTYWHAHIDELTVATEEEVTAEVERQHAADQFKPGDKVRLVSGGRELPLLGFDDGGIYTVGLREDDDRLTIKRQDGKKGYAKHYQLEKATDEEAKWAALGRKVGEFKAGDTVRFLGHSHYHGLNEHVGIITTIERTNGEFSPYRLSMPDFVTSDYNTWTKPEELELIAPVESTVNLRVA
ncbi:hypothetical protein [Brevibacillus laterosporus]|uniref:hypothetical protein n=1 Tax=Brevibacillus laterosporus TaxID=1465 RepID=UPI00264D1DC7|nr:hypothetical protein [Brevibacillus laterosporus]MDN9010034.1 hypothetical protein [Brevibacillus laterosporus]MDO0940584.1 hypothetical protein [Brevibacillus laterosporus]